MTGATISEEQALAELSETFFRRKIDEVYARTDRMFAYVMLFEYLLAIAFAFIFSPKTWSGPVSSVHPHVWSAIFLGGLLASFPIYLAITAAGEISTRFVIAVAQSLFSALLIHLSGGHLETHFHVFGSLAFLACYRDWRVLVVSSAIVAFDHVVRGIWFPVSLYGVAADSTWRFIEHAAWVVFEDSFLIVACVRGVKDLQGTAFRNAEAELAKKGLEVARDEAQRANRAKSEFLSRMSHELRTPLNSVLGFGQILQIDELSEDQEESVSHILSGGNHLLKLIDDILDISGIEAGRMTISKEPINVAEIVAETRSMAYPLASEAGIKLVEPEIPEDAMYILADHQRLRQVLLNLISNAIKYNVPQGEVRISAVRDGERLRILVADTGIGIPEEKRSLLFNPFERLGAQETSIQGTGLGLSLSKNLVEAMGGTLSLTPSTAGTCFCIELAATSCPLSSFDDGDVQLFQPVWRDVETTILVIEDNPTNIRLIERIVEANPSYRLVVAKDGQTGLNLAKTCSPDLILLDLDLPEIYGGELLKRFRAGAVKPETPIIIVTADASRHQAEILVADGATAFITKPLDIERFRTVIDEFCMPDFSLAA
jgi:two-component system sensor histidine kinase/response regulator